MKFIPENVSKGMSLIKIHFTLNIPSNLSDFTQLGGCEYMSSSDYIFAMPNKCCEAFTLKNK